MTWRRGLLCFDLGADDCMMKPFSLAELRARCRALARRRRDAAWCCGMGRWRWTGWSVVVCDGRAVELTGKEFALLEYLLLNRGRAVSRAGCSRGMEDAGGKRECGGRLCDVSAAQAGPGRGGCALIEDHCAAKDMPFGCGSGASAREWKTCGKSSLVQGEPNMAAATLKTDYNRRRGPRLSPAPIFLFASGSARR